MTFQSSSNQCLAGIVDKNSGGSESKGASTEITPLLATSPTDQPARRASSPDRRVLRVKEGHETVRLVQNVSDIDMSSQTWTVIKQGCRQLSLLFEIDELRDRVIDIVNRGQATLTTFDKVDVGDCCHMTKPVDVSIGFLGFIVVDVGYRLLLSSETSTLFDREVFSCSVLVNDPAVVTPQHSDLDAGITFVLRGQKTFRVLTTNWKKSKMGSKRLWARTDSDPPTGWQDIVVDAGCALFVPKERPHCVLSSDNSIAVSLTFKQALPKNLSRVRPVFVDKDVTSAPPLPNSSPHPHPTAVSHGSGDVLNIPRSLRSHSAVTHASPPSAKSAVVTQKRKRARKNSAILSVAEAAYEDGRTEATSSSTGTVPEPTRLDIALLNADQIEAEPTEPEHPASHAFEQRELRPQLQLIDDDVR